MHNEIGSFDAKARLSELLREVQRGQRYTITLRGRPVADLVPCEHAGREDARASIEAMRGIRKVQGVAEQALKDWVAEGRR